MPLRRSLHQEKNQLHILVGHILSTGSISHQIYLLSPEVCAAGAENHLVGLEALALGGQGDVDEVLLLEQVLERRGERELVVVPLQTELVGHSEEEGPWSLK